MKNSIILALVFATSGFSLLGINDVFAVTCSFSGNTTYCTDPQTGKGTTYNMYGDKIYGSDGSTATIYNDPVYNMGSGISPVSLAGIDMDSPEMKEALRKYEEGCPPGGGFNGGAQAATCRNAVVEWLEAVSNAPRFESSGDSDSEEDDSDYSDSMGESLDEILSRFGISSESPQSKDLCVSGGILNSYQVGDGCVCNNGYINNNNKCVPLSIQSCEAIYGIGSVPIDGTSECKCNVGYAQNSTKEACIPLFNTRSNSETYSPPAQQLEKVSVNFEVKSEDILSLNENGNVNSEAVLRECPSTQCSKIESYPKGTVVEIMGKYKNDTWLKVNVINSKAGWMHQSLIDTVIKQAELEDNISEPIKMTRAEFETKFGVPVPDEVEAETSTKKVSLWKKIISWFGF